MTKLYIKYCYIIGGPTPPPVDHCKPLFQCQSNNKCIPHYQVCDFEIDCPNGEDESSVSCGYPQGFEGRAGLGSWSNSVDDDYEFLLYHELKPSILTAPVTDARGDKNGNKLI